MQILPPTRKAPGPADPWAGRGRLPGVRRIIAVGAGKGGVGRSTVAVGLTEEKQIRPLEAHGLAVASYGEVPFAFDRAAERVAETLAMHGGRRVASALVARGERLVAAAHVTCGA